jgi:diketogulonate reductase-like aldo/keto reductase
MSAASEVIGVGFGTAALGEHCQDIVLMALKAGFRKFDTAEADWWYDQKAVGLALKTFFTNDCTDGEQCKTCTSEDIRISTKIPPWSLTSATDIRAHAADSRQELVGFCQENHFPLDVYYIHAPACWEGWHPRCDDAPSTLALRDAWMAMEAVVGIDNNARRIGLSNVGPAELRDIIQFVKDRPVDSYPPPRMPDVLQAFADPISPSEELRRICAFHGIEFVSYSTLGTQHRGKSNPVLTSPIVKELAHRHDRSVAEVVLSWALQKDMSVIPRSTQENHIAELAKLLTQPPFLSPQDLEAIDSMKLN